MARWRLSVREYWDRVLLVEAETADGAADAYDRDPAAANELDFEFLGIEPDGEEVAPFEGDAEGLPASPAGFRGDPGYRVPQDGRKRWRIVLTELWDRVFLVEAEDEDEAFEAYVRNPDALREIDFVFAGLDRDGESIEPYEEG